MALMLITTCCGCCSIRSGSYISALYTLLLSMGTIATAFFYITNMLYQNSDYHESVQLALFIWWIVFIAVGVFLLLASILLVATVRRDRYLWFIPWIFMMVLFVCFSFIMMITFIVWTGFNPETVVFLALWVLITILNVCSLVCVISHYKDVANMY